MIKSNMDGNVTDIIYIIFATGKANGGHYRSLVVTAENMAKHRTVKIIVLGYTYSHIVKNSSVDSEFIFFNGLNLKTVINGIKNNIISKSTILHAFDVYAYLPVRIIGIMTGNPVLMTKCGGSNPKGFFPKIENLALFSSENIEYFKAHPKFQDSNIELIPNRVEAFDCDVNKIEHLKRELGLSPNKRVILRICRISRMYRKSLTQSISLFNFIKTHDDNTVLIILGNIQDQHVYDEITKVERKDVFVVTDEKYTSNAKEMLDIADWVVGTGRGFMEASSKRKVLLSVSNYSEVPTLITLDNFTEAFKYNFSERIIFKTVDQLANIDNIIEAINNIKVESALKENAGHFFSEYFVIDKGISRYKNLYNNLKEPVNDKKDIFLQYIFFIKANLGTWYRILATKI